MMKYYSVEISPRSPFRHPILADTLWGHICWLIREKSGESDLVNFIEQFNSDKPPFFFSDAFPTGNLPMPIFPFPLHELKNRLDKDSQKDMKNLRKRENIPYNILFKMRESFSPVELYENLSRAGSAEMNINKYTEPHVAIDRNTLAAAEGQLHFEESITFMNASNNATSSLWLLIAVMDSSSNDIKTICGFIRDVGLLGYGADRTIGRGAFDVSEPAPFEWPVANPDWAFSLSHFCPASNDPSDGYYDLFTKFGKVGNIYSSSHVHPDIPFTPFKKPLIMLTPGSCFKYSASQKGFWGRLVPNIHRYKEVVHYAFTPVLPLKMKSE